MHRTRYAPGGGSGPHPGEQGSEPVAGCRGRVGQGRLERELVLQVVAGVRCEVLRLLDGDADPQSEVGPDPEDSVRLRLRAHHADLSEQERAESRISRLLRRDHSEYRAALQRNGKRIHSRGPPEVHGAAAMPHLSWRTVEARGIGGNDRRAEYSG